jgi:hypothetical protein
MMSSISKLVRAKIKKQLKKEEDEYFDNLPKFNTNVPMPECKPPSEAQYRPGDKVTLSPPEWAINKHDWVREAIKVQKEYAGYLVVDCTQCGGAMLIGCYRWWFWNEWLRPYKEKP